jgi:hypothetical protein
LASVPVLDEEANPAAWIMAAASECKDGAAPPSKRDAMKATTLGHGPDQALGGRPSTAGFDVVCDLLNSAINKRVVLWSSSTSRVDVEVNDADNDANCSHS